jgi:hypothetical protein
MDTPTTTPGLLIKIWSCTTITISWSRRRKQGKIVHQLQTMTMIWRMPLGVVATRQVTRRG